MEVSLDDVMATVVDQLKLLLSLNGVKVIRGTIHVHVRIHLHVRIYVCMCGLNEVQNW